MNDKRKKEIVGKLTDEHKKTLKQWSNEADKDMKKLVTQFCELYDKEVAETTYGDDEDARINYALNAVRGRIANEMATPTEEVEIYVLGISPPGTLERDDGSETQIASVFSVGTSEAFDELKIIEITGWGEEASMVNQLEYGTSYKMNVSRQSSASKQQVDYQFESHTEFEETEFDPENVPKLLEQFFPKVEIARAKEHESTSRSDYKMIRGIIEDINFLSKSEDGRQLARIEIMDSSVALKDVSETGLFSVLMPASMAQFGPDSEVAFIGRINIDDEYGAGMFAQGLAPILAHEYEKDLSEVSEEELTIEDAEEAMAEEAIATPESGDDDEYDDLI